ncbi:hypothetical protein AB0F77_38470 [Streptomyces sp. NPDC026672]|uniref:hypothetical protein n=1 Tax=unclassified Streptomyces TaxID=2593676 RepID=UPI0034067549
MGSLRLTLCTGILVVGAFVPTAHAADGDGVRLTPSSPAPDSDVALRVSGCASGTGTAVSDAFARDTALAGTGGTLRGEGRIGPLVPPGSYDVVVTCGDTRLIRTVTIAGTEQAVSSLGEQVAPVPAGGGGMAAHFASVDLGSDGPGAAHAVTGLVLAGLAALAVGLLPRARRGRGRR